MRACLILSHLIFMFVFTAEATIRRVPQDYAKIQLAISASTDGDTVLVSEGTYTENLKISKKIIVASLFINDGDTAHISRTIISGASPTHPDSGSAIHIFGSSDTTTIIKGFTITGGKGTIAVFGSSVFAMGGGIYISAGGARISYNIIAQNAVNTSYGAEGGGICLYRQNGEIYNWIIENNIIKNNRVRSTASSTYRPIGGGCALYGGNGIVRNNIIEGNDSYGYYLLGRGGGMFFGGESGLSAYIRIENNIIKSNTANQVGAGITIWNPTTTWNHSYFIKNNIIAKNYAPQGGGGIYTYRRATIQLINNTIVQNYAPYGSGLFCAVSVSTTWAVADVYGFNNIFWNHGPFKNDIDGVMWDRLYNNLIKGESSRGIANIKGDPRFIDTVSYRLSPESPCLGSGTMWATINNIAMEAPLKDIYGADRPRDPFSNPDLGAIEEDASSGSQPELPRGIMHSFTHQGLQRNYVVIPPRFFASDSGRPVLLHLNCYGCGIDWEMNILELFKNCDSLGIYTVYPEAYQLVWNSGISANSGYPAPPTDDVDFILKMIDTLKAKYRIDPQKVFLFGFSNGSFMVQKALAAAGDKFRGCIGIGGVLTSLSTGGVLSNSVAPIMLVHGNADDQVPFYGGNGFWSVPQTVNWWRNRNKATVLFDSVRINGNGSDGSTVDRMMYNDSTGREMVRFYRVNIGGHNYPGGPEYFASGIVNRDIDIRVEAMNFINRIIVGTENETPAQALPESFSLEQNYPNPFNPSTIIRYSVPVSAGANDYSRVQLKVFDILGNEVAVLVDKEQAPGNYKVEFSVARNSIPRLTSGVYFYQLRADNVVITRKMLLMK